MNPINLVNLMNHEPYEPMNLQSCYNHVTS
jgi:hypothetical protein